MGYKIELTTEAIAYIKAKLASRKTPDASLRLGVKGGQCSGYAYHIEYEDDPPREKDLVFEFDGLKVIVDKKSIIYLNGSVLDYEKTIMREGLKFRNPNEASSCGCGASFSIK